MIEKIRYKRAEWADAPYRAHKGDAGLDIKAPYDTFMYPGHGCIIDSGISVEIPHGYYGQLHSRSSKFRVGVVNDGVIDSQYRGNIGIVLWNVSEDIVDIKKGDRIVQLLILPCETDYELEEVEELSETERGSGGFGSTGR